MEAQVLYVKNFVKNTLYIYLQANSIPIDSIIILSLYMSHSAEVLTVHSFKNILNSIKMINSLKTQFFIGLGDIIGAEYLRENKELL